MPPPPPNTRRHFPPPAPALSKSLPYSYFLQFSQEPPLRYPGFIHPSYVVIQVLCNLIILCRYPIVMLNNNCDPADEEKNLSIYIYYCKAIKGTVQRNLRWVLSNINQFVSLWAVVASPWFCQKYGRHFEIHEKRFSTI
jgi:hypothetical protein